MRRRDMHTEICSVILKERDSMENPDMDECMILKWPLEK